jgi:hypothetical protein
MVLIPPENPDLSGRASVAGGHRTARLPALARHAAHVADDKDSELVN